MRTRRKPLPCHRQETRSDCLAACLRDIEAQQLQIGKGQGRSSAVPGKGQRSERERTGKCSGREAMKKLVDKLQAERERPTACGKEAQ